MSQKTSPVKKLFRIVGYLLLFVVIIIGAIVLYVKVALPNVGKPPEMQVALTPEKIDRGKYLANAVCACMDCHSKRDWSKYAGPLVDGTLGMGGERFDQGTGFPGVYYSKNITPAGITRYSDGELFRVITTGVNKDGRAMFPVMPYLHYGRMDTADITSIIAYIRSLQAIDNPVPESTSDFPVSVLINTFPKKAAPEKKPEESDLPGYGKYLVNASGCVECHSPVDKGEIILDKAFSGGREFRFPSGAVIRSANITFDKGTGLGNWTEEIFIKKFTSYSDSSYHAATLSAMDKNTVMPWMMYSHMSEKDLKAIYTYLKTLPAQQNRVTTFSPPVAKR